MRKVELSGKRIGRLVAIQRAGRNKFGQCIWLCQCDCGNQHKVLTCGLTSATTRSCGCLSTESKKLRPNRVTHGFSRRKNVLPEYTIYCSAKARCNNPNTDSYPIYGGRGIKFKFKSFMEFYSLVGPRPKGMSIERINNNGHYESGNVKWATAKEQAMNRRTSL